jgi:hypothetical protein
VQAVALLRGGAADFRIVGREQQSPDSDEIVGRRPMRYRRSMRSALLLGL